MAVPRGGLERLLEALRRAETPAALIGEVTGEGAPGSIAVE
jgi:hypothetical protein